MSGSAIMAALRTGPKTTADLVNEVGIKSAYVARTCSRLMQKGLVRRVDDGYGRGSRARYALADGSAPPLPIRRVEAKSRRVAEYPAHQHVYRDPCPFCGVRADIGCRHLKAA